MMELNKNQIGAVSGANGGAILAGALVGLAVVGLIKSSSCQVVYEPVTYTVYTPVYDAFGFYIGDTVDTYVDYQPVYIC